MSLERSETEVFEMGRVLRITFEVIGRNFMSLLALGLFALLPAFAFQWLVEGTNPLIVPLLKSLTVFGSEHRVHSWPSAFD